MMRQRTMLTTIFASATLLTASARVSRGDETAPAEGMRTTSQVAGADEVSGGFRTSVPFALPGFHGIGPSLGVAYSSSGGVDLAGRGWRLVGASSIERHSPGGGVPHFDERDRYYLDGEELLRCADASSAVRECAGAAAIAGMTMFTTRSGAGLRIGLANEGASSAWHVWSPSGAHTTYGLGQTTQHGHAYRWRQTRVEDPSGNAVSYTYESLGAEDAGALTQIAYGPYLVRLGYTTQPVPTPQAVGDGTLALQRRQLAWVDVQAHGVRQRAYQLAYTASQTSGASLLASVQEFGADATIDASGSLTGSALPATLLYYDGDAHGAGRVEQALSPKALPALPPAAPRAPTTTALAPVDLRPGEHAQYLTFDLDGDLRADRVQLVTGTGLVTLTALLTQPNGTVVAGPPAGIALSKPPTGYRIVTADFDGDGAPDIGVVGLGAHRADGRDAVTAAIARFDGTSFAIDYDDDGVGVDIDITQARNAVERVDAGDFDGDGLADLALSDLDAGVAYIAGGDGRGDFRGRSIVRLMDNPAGAADDASPVVAVAAVDRHGDYRASLVAGVVRQQARLTSFPFPIGDVWSPYNVLLVNTGDDESFAVEISEERTIVGLTVATRQVGERTAMVAVVEHEPFFGVRVATLTSERRSLAAQRPFYYAAPDTLRFDDLDGDGYDEVYTVTHTCIGRGTPSAHTLHSLLYASFHRTTDELLTEQELELEPSPGCDDGYVDSDFAVADMDGDGRNELVTTVPAALRIPLAWGWMQVPMKTVTYHLGAAPGADGQWVQMDADGNGEREWVRLSTAAGLLRIDRFPRAALGLYETAPAPVYISLFDSPLPLAGFRVADIDGDGRDDLVQVAADGATVRFVALQRAADGQWGAATRVASSSAAGLVNQARWHLADTDGDGMSEWLFLASRPNGPGAAACPFPQLTRPWTYRYKGAVDNEMDVVAGGDISTCDTYPQSTAWQVADLDGDGADDLVGAWPILDATVGPRTKIEALLSRRDGTFASVASIVAGSPVSPMDWYVTDLNGDGARDLMSLAAYPDDPVTTLEIPITAQQRLFAARHPEIADAMAGTRKARAISLVGLLSAGDGTMREALREDVAATHGSHATEWRLADINGDDIPDLIRLHAEQARWTGGAPVPWDFVYPPNYEAGCRGIDELAAAWYSQCYAGSAEACAMVPWAVESFCYSIREYRANETRLMTRALVWSATGLTLGAAIDSAARDANAGLMVGSAVLGDSDGDLRPELTSIESDFGVPTEYRTLLQRPEAVLSRIVSPLGAITEISYASSAQAGGASPWFTGCLAAPAPSWVVSDLRTRASADGPASATTYARACPMWSTTERRFLGWQYTTVDDAGATTADGVVRPATLTATLNQVDAACGARAMQVMTTGAAGGSRHTETTYAPTGEPPYFCAATRTQTTETDETGGQRTLLQRFEYDAARDLLVLHDDGLVTDGADDRATVMTTIHAPGPFLTRTAQTATHAGSPTGPVIAQTRTCYDAEVGCGAAGLWRGLPVRSEAWDDHSSTWLGTTTTYDAVGNPNSTTDAVGRTSHIEYEPAWGLYPIRATNPRGDSVRMDYDDPRVAGAITTTFDEANGVLLTEQHYDVFGQPEWSYIPGSGTTWSTTDSLGVPGQQSVTTTRMPGRVATRPDFAYQLLWSRRYFDGAGRVVREERPGDTGLATRVTEYADASGPAYRVSKWTDGGTQELWLQSTRFDAWGRPVTTTRADGYQSTTTYAVDGTRTVDALGLVAQTEFDGRGRTVAVHEPHEGTSEVVTRYAYDDVAHQIHTTDPAGNVATTTKDSLGRVRAVSDPDLGELEYDYYDDGSLATSTDGNGVTTTLTYDALGRPMTRTNSANARTITYVYDEPAAAGATLGRLTSVFDSAATGPAVSGACAGRARRLTYDELGRLTGTQRCLDAVAAAVTFGYDDLGRPKSLIYPDGEVVENQYDSLGRLFGLSGVVDAATYDLQGNLSTLELANQVTESFGYDWMGTKLTWQSVTGPSGYLGNQSYGYNLRDQLQSYSGGGGGVFRYLFMQYDGQNRLTSVNGSRNEQFTYDVLGNMTSHTGAVYGASGTVTLGLGSYSYPTNGVQVHAATTAGDRTFTYDLAGNLLDELKAGQPSRRFVWNDSNLPTEVGVFVDDGDAVEEPSDWQTTQYTYGDDGRRVKAVSPTGEVTYTLFPEVEHNQLGQLSKAYFFAGRMVARADESGLRTYFHADRLSSTALVTDEVGHAVSSGAYDYTAFGERLSGAPGVAQNFLFTGARQDGATAAEAGGGLIDLNARLYDPITARFISADTVTTGPGVLGHNRYAYASQNPLNRVDPTGHTDLPVVARYDFEDELVVGHRPAPAPAPVAPDPVDHDFDVVPFDDVAWAHQVVANAATEGARVMNQYQDDLADRRAEPFQGLGVPGAPEIGDPLWWQTNPITRRIFPSAIDVGVGAFGFNVGGAVSIDGRRYTTVGLSPSGNVYKHLELRKVMDIANSGFMRVARRVTRFTSTRGLVRAIVGPTITIGASWDFTHGLKTPTPAELHNGLDGPSLNLWTMCVYVCIGHSMDDTTHSFRVGFEPNIGLSIGEYSISKERVR